MRIERIQVSGFLGLDAVDVHTPQPVQLFAGRNGAGKTSLRDAIALALTGDLNRVTLKKDAPALIRTGSSGAFVQVTNSDGDQFQVTISQTGKINEKRAIKSLDEVYGYVMDAQRFARLGDTDRRAFLNGMLGLSSDSNAIVARLIKRGCSGAKIERLASLLRAGFDAAHDHAKLQATEAKGAWRQLTGENYGPDKATHWTAAVPAYDKQALATLATEIQHADVAIASWQQEIGKLNAEKQRRAGLLQRMPALQEHAARIERIRAKLAVDEKTLAEVAEKLAAMRAAAGGAPRVGLVHDLAKLVTVAIFQSPADEERAQQLLDQYEREHGSLDSEGTGDLLVQSEVPAAQHAHDVASSAVANDHRDLDAALQAKAQLDGIVAELAQAFDQGALDKAQADLEQVQQQRAAAVQRLDTIKALKTKADAADKLTKDAAAKHADVAEWSALAEALGPDGIPADLLAEAIGPVNERLAQSGADAGWPLVGIDKDMAITYGGRPYRLISESERWRADAMIAEAIAQLSGTRMLVLDRFDVLDLQGRSDLIGWLDVLAQNGEIDSAVILGTLKAPPEGLPDTIGVHWIQGGQLLPQQLKEAA